VVDVGITHPVDLPPVHLGGDPLRIPVGQQPDGDDDLVHPGGDAGTKPVRATRTVDQTDDASSLKGPQPVVQGSATTPKLPTGHLDSGSLCQPDGPHPLPNSIG